MRVRGIGGDEFELRVAGYQFPDIQNDKYDANWLLIDLQATASGQSWRSRDACLLTWEVAELAAWLDTLARGNIKVPREIEFIEPNLIFEIIVDEGRAGTDSRLLQS